MDVIAAEILTEFTGWGVAMGEYDEQVAWCIEHFGPKALFRDHVDDNRPWLTEYAGDGRWWWYFAHEEYATLFALRWL